MRSVMGPFCGRLFRYIGLFSTSFGNAVEAVWVVYSTGWQRPRGCLIFIGHFPQKSPIVSGSFARNALQLEASYGSSPPCSMRAYNRVYVSVCVCVCISVCVCFRLRVWVWLYMSFSLSVSVSVSILIYVQTCLRPYQSVSVLVNVCARVYACIFVC